jgi:FixJ family two-component response regulator
MRSTDEVHRAHLMRKLGADNLIDLVNNGQRGC